MQFSISSVQRLSVFIITLILLFAITQTNSYAKEKQPVLGAGPSTVVTELFFQLFSTLEIAQNYDFIVPPRSIKHAGGIQACGKYLFGRTGRPLNEKELAQNKHDLFIARIPLAFVVGKKTGVKRINLQQLEAIFTRKIANWKQLGGADANIILAGREPTEAAFSAIRHKHPYFNQTRFDIVLTRDHQLVNFIDSPKGDYAIGFGAQTNFDSKQLLPVDGFNTSISLGLVYDTKNRDHPVIKAAIEFANSETWKTLIVRTGLLAPDN